MSDVDVCAESRRRRAGKAREGGGEREPESQGAREAKVRKSNSERLRVRALAVGETCIERDDDIVEEAGTNKLV